MRYEKSAEAIVVKKSDESQKERRAEQSISWSKSRIAEEITFAVTNRVNNGQIERDGKETTHGNK